MIWKSSVKGSTTIIAYHDPNLEGRRVKIFGYAPSLDDLGPPHLILPDGHTGTLTGLVTLEDFSHKLPSKEDGIPIDCTAFVEIAWDDIRRWHYDFCRHHGQTYRPSCLIDWFMGQHKVYPGFLFFISDDQEQGKGSCVKDEICMHMQGIAAWNEKFFAATYRSLKDL